MTNLRAILFDLDDTLLGNRMDVFGPAYFRALTDYAAHLIPRERLFSALLAATRQVDANDGSGPTNEEVFASAFYPALGFERDELEPLFNRFYAEEFPRLRRLTRRRPEARRLVTWAFEHGLQVVIATNPLFPRSPTEQRLDWAGAPVSAFPYDLVTSYENMHATKANPAYYGEIVERLGRKPEECLMVGDDWQRDILPAAAVGVSVYWIAPVQAGPSMVGVPLIGQGTLATLWRQAQNEELTL